MEVTLRARTRSGSGKGPARQTRLGGRVPAVLYGRGMEPVSLAVDAKQLGQVMHTTAGANVLVNLEVEGGESYLTMVREVVKHPVRGHFVHVDFVNTDRDVKTHAEVPVTVVGESQGIREGGVIEHHIWALKVGALPGDIPTSIEADISALQIGDHLRVSDIVAPRGVDLHDDPEAIVLSVIEPHAIKAAEAAEVETGEPVAE
ncbi:MAG TPA: 50S ribosomal protein L25 [Actinomycetota bacterium]|nr:50S ribosomal protein L25 [Actinomycetota bacterium]